MAHDHATHQHTEQHHGNHHGPAEITSLNKAFIIGIVLNLAYVIVQIVIGLNVR